MSTYALTLWFGGSGDM